jgi:UDP-N-acetyl-D-galactosamine dehydrogenase
MTQARESSKVAVLGLGYVGLPLAVAFGKTLRTVGFDINARRIAELNERRDRTLEIDAEELAASKHLTFSSSTDDLADCTVFIITVPTPIDSSNRPDLTALLRASETVGKVLKRGDVVIYESTVYPGATEEDCVPVLENISGLTFNVDFFCGYSPERANPGDREHRLATIMKVTAGSTPEITDFVDGLYRTIVTAGTHKAPSIRVAEAAKVIENTQRDLNIALINELAIIFNRLNIDTEAVLQAAGTKWNFLPFRPGLVGGHCIGVDPYYLTHKAQLAGYHPEVILAGRRINDGMGNYVVAQLVKAMVRKRIQVEGARVLILGLAFKENCPDLRNTRVVDIIEELKGYNISADVHDPWIDEGEAQHEYGISPVSTPKAGAYDAIVLAVAHRQFREMGPEGVRAFGAENHVLYDLKSLLPAGSADLRL